MRSEVAGPTPILGVGAQPRLQVWDTGGQSVVQSKCFAPVDVQTMLADVGDDANSSPPTIAETSTKDDAPTKSGVLNGVDSHHQPATCAASGTANNSRTAWGLVALIALACSRRHRRLTLNARQRRGAGRIDDRCVGPSGAGIEAR